MTINFLHMIWLQSAHKYVTWSPTSPIDDDFQLNSFARLNQLPSARKYSGSLAFHELRLWLTTFLWLKHQVRTQFGFLKIIASSIVSDKIHPVFASTFQKDLFTWSWVYDSVSVSPSPATCLCEVGPSQNNACWGMLKPGVLCILLQGLNAGGERKLGLYTTTHWMGVLAYMEALAYALLTYNMELTLGLN